MEYDHLGMAHPEELLDDLSKEISAILFLPFILVCTSGKLGLALQGVLKVEVWGVGGRRCRPPTPHDLSLPPRLPRSLCGVRRESDGTVSKAFRL